MSKPFFPRGNGKRGDAEGTAAAGRFRFTRKRISPKYLAKKLWNRMRTTSGVWRVGERAYDGDTAGRFAALEKKFFPG